MGLESDFPGSPNWYTELDFFKELRVNGTRRLDGRTYQSIGRGCVIEISRSHISDREKRMKHYLETLLQEMCHAFLIIYCCKEGKDKGEDKMCGSNELKGHGPTWRKMAWAVEQSSAEYLGMRLDLGVLYNCLL